MPARTLYASSALCANVRKLATVMACSCARVMEPVWRGAEAAAFFALHAGAITAPSALMSTDGALVPRFREVGWVIFLS